MGTTNASQPQAPIRVITMELWPQESHPSYGDGFYIGVEGGPHVADLVEGESVILRETGDVEITATAHHVMLDGRPVWFGELTSDYRDISSDTNDTPNTSTAQSLNSY